MKKFKTIITASIISIAMSMHVFAGTTDVTLTTYEGSAHMYDYINVTTTDYIAIPLEV